MKFITYIILLFTFASCNKKINESIIQRNNNIGFFDPIIFDSEGLNVTLNLSAQFSECGEFGGHKELMKIYTNQKKEFYLDYKKFGIDCRNLSENHDLVFSKTLEINEENKKSIVEYIHRMIDAKIRERNDSNAANSFSVNISDSTFVIEVNDLNEENIRSYKTLLNDLKLE